jgi:hypothetical protein
MRRRTERGAGRVVHGYLTVNVCKIDLSITNNLKAVFAPTFRMWVEGREDEVTVVQVGKKAIPMWVGPGNGWFRWAASPHRSTPLPSLSSVD